MYTQISLANMLGIRLKHLRRIDHALYMININTANAISVDVVYADAFGV